MTQRQKILIVEDDPVMLKLHVAFLREIDTDIVTSTSGEEAVAKALTHDFDLLLMDIGLPGIDGFEALRVIKKQEKYKFIPAIFITATYEGEASALDGLDIGAIDYIYKPAVKGILSRKVKNLLELQRNRKELESSNKELEMHQIELELLNEELMLAKNSAVDEAEKYTQLYDFAPLGYFSLSRDGEIIELNLSGAKMLGKDRKSFKKRLFGSYVSAATKTIFNQFLDKVFASKYKESCEVSLSTSADLPIIVHLEGVVNKNAEQCLINAIDITEQKMNEKEMAFKENRYKQLIDTIPEKIFTKDRTSVYLDCNELYAKDLNSKPEKIIGKTDFDFFPKELAEKYRADDKKIMESDESETFEEEYIQNGERKFIHTIKTQIRDNENKVTGVLGIFHDITERKQLEESLAKNQNRLNEAQAIANLGSWDWDIVTDIIYSSDEFCHIFGFDIGKKWTYKEFLLSIHPEDINSVKDAVKVSHDNRSPYDIEYRIILPDGKTKHIHAKGIVTVDKNKDAIKMSGIVLDVTNIKNANLEKERVSAEIRDLYDNAPCGYHSLDKDGIFVRINNTELSWFGYTREELVGKKKFTDICTSNSQEVFKENFPQFMKLGTVRDLEFEVICKDGSTKTLLLNATAVKDDSGNYIMSRSTMIDITEKIKHQLYLSGMEKYKTLSIMTRGIAHDFNNLLTGIYNYIYLANTQSKEDKVSRYLQSTLETIERAKNLSQQLLTFTGDCPPIKKRQALFPFIKNTAEFIIAGKNIMCKFNIPDKISQCYFDKNQIGQVIDNIIINAVQAMPNGGTIVISAENITIKKHETPTLRGGEYVRISIKDSGIGIHDTVLSKVFDPFFSTKQGGSGLGLATSYSIIKMHNGSITVESEQGKGSTFYIYLPASLKTAEKTGVKEEPERSHCGKGRFLIMDDEEYIRQSLSKILENMGYSVESACNGEEALDLFRKSEKSGNPFIAAIFDMTIHDGMGGEETVKKLRHLNSGIPVFASSGYSDIKTLDFLENYGFNDYLPKPYRAEDLEKLLNKHLNNFSKETVGTKKNNKFDQATAMPINADKTNILISDTIHALNNQNHVIMLNISLLSQAFKEILEGIKNLPDDSLDISVIGLPIEKAATTLTGLIGGIERGSKKIQEIVQAEKLKRS